MDPILQFSLSICMCVLFASASMHKFVRLDQFKISLRDYQVLPGASLAGVAILIPSIELILAVTWLLQIAPVMSALTSVTLLGIYCLAIGINLARGRAHINCGCGFAGTNDVGTPISSGLILRNGALILLLLASLLSPVSRELLWIDYIVIVLSSAVAILLYISTSQLLSNRSAMASWRTR
jgi:hypothetical protein